MVMIPPYSPRSVQNIELKQTDGRTDATDCFAFPPNAVVNSNNVIIVETFVDYNLKQRFNRESNVKSSIKGCFSAQINLPPTLIGD